MLLVFEEAAYWGGLKTTWAPVPLVDLICFKVDEGLACMTEVDVCDLTMVGARLEETV